MGKDLPPDLDRSYDDGNIVVRKWLCSDGTTIDVPEQHMPDGTINVSISPEDWKKVLGR